MLSILLIYYSFARERSSLKKLKPKNVAGNSKLKESTSELSMQWCKDFKIHARPWTDIPRYEYLDQITFTMESLILAQDER